MKTRNTPVTTLIKNYTNKKSGKVSEARNEIRRRFDFLDWKDQKKILLSFLDSGKTDRNWAYTKLLDYWDTSFEPKVKELWEQLHEQRCAWAVLRYFPVEYIIQNEETFTEERDYYFICLRLAMNKDYVIDKSRLSITDYLSVLYHTRRTISHSEAMDCLFDVVQDKCVNGFTFVDIHDFDETARDEVCAPLQFREIRLATYYLNKLECFSAVNDFEDWNEKVRNAIINSPGYTPSIKEQQMALESGYCDEMLDLTRKCAYHLLDEKYRHPSDSVTFLE